MNFNDIIIKSRQKSKKNCTHDSVVDLDIKNASLWKINKYKHIFEIILYFLSLGIIYLIQEFIFPNLFIILSCQACNIKEAQFIKIITKTKRIYIISLRFEKKKEIESEIFKSNELMEFKYNNEENDNSYRKLMNPQMTLENWAYFKLEKITIEGQEKTNSSNLIKKYLNYDIYFEFLENIYKYNDKNNYFFPVFFYSNLFLKNELLEMKSGIPDIKTYNNLKNLYPKNEIKIKEKRIIITIISKFLKKQYLYCYFSIIIWIINEYYIYSLMIGLLIFILEISASYRTIQNINSINSVISSKISVNRFGKIIEINSKEIVPGDSIILKKENNKLIIVPCDGIILEGYCTVNESDLTGENTLGLKKELEINSNNKNDKFDYQIDKNSILFQGSKIHSLFSKEQNKEIIILLATNTGANTYRGNMIQNWEKHEPDKYKFDSDLLILGILIFLIWIISIIIVFKKYKYIIPKKGEKYNILKDEINKGNFENYIKSVNIFNFKFKDKILECLDNISIIFPPSLIISIEFGRFYHCMKLRNHNIYSIFENKIELAGKVDIIVLDKTGTLTESTLEINCYKPTNLNKNGNIILGNEELNPSILNKIYKKFWKNIYSNKVKCELENKKMDYSYQKSLLYNIIYYTECVASCHNIFKINNEYFGNSLEQKLFSVMNWELNQEFDSNNNFMYIQPHNSYKITETTLFNNSLFQNKKINIEPEFYLKYLERYEFKSDFQSMSVVVQNSIDESINVYTKGAPEKIKRICLKNTIPLDLDEQLKKYTGKGFRVLACSFKRINSFDKKKSNINDLENNMIFLGLIIFQNHLKKDTKIHIKNLNKSKCKIVIATGDNVFTTISIAQQCKILNKKDDLFRFELMEKKNKSYLSLFHNGSRENINKLLIQNNNNLISLSNESEKEEFYIEEKDKYFEKVIEEIINNPNSKICCSGNALIYILEKILDFKKREKQNLKIKNNNNKIKLITEKEKNYISNLDKLIRIKGKIFYRMLPDNKSRLISFFQNDKKTIVIMCGDGANDSNALIQSDIGISINQKKGNNLISHFYTNQSSISCLEYIIKNGRASYENKIIIIKYLLICSLIEISSVIFLRINYRTMNDNQIFFNDFLGILIPILLSSCTNCYDNISKIKLPKNIFNKYFIFNILGIIIIEIFGLINFGLLIKKHSIFWEYDILPKNGICILSSYIFFYCLFQYLTVLFLFNMQCVYKKPIYTNTLYFLYYTIVLFICIYFITNSDISSFNLFLFEPNIKNFEYRYEFNRIITIEFTFGVIFLCTIYKIFISKIFKEDEEGINLF